MRKTIIGLLIFSMATLTFPEGQTQEGGKGGGVNPSTTPPPMLPSEEHAPVFSIGLFGGLSTPIAGTLERWNPGFDVGADLFGYFSKYTGLGLHFAYDRWSPDRDGWTEGLGLTNTDVTGAFNTLEFIPSLRLKSNYSTPINIFIQGGYGLFVYGSEAHVTGTSSTGIPVSSTLDNGKWVGRWGFQAGGGVSIGNPNAAFYVMPLYNLVFTPSTAVQYLTFNAGIQIGY
jgi:hypothetical protein